MKKQSIFGQSAYTKVAGLTLGAVYVLYAGYILFFSDGTSGVYTRLALESNRIEQLPLAEKLNAVGVAINQSDVAANAAVFMLWVIVGLFVYSSVAVLVRAFKAGKGTVETLRVVSNNQRRTVAEGYLLKFFVRLCGVAGIFLLYKGLLLGVPYGLVWFESARWTEGLFLKGMLLVLGFSFLYLVVWLVALSLRLVMLRKRIFFE